MGNSSRIEIEKWIDGWAGSYDWRKAIKSAETTPEEELSYLQNLEKENPNEEPHPGTWEEVLEVLRKEL